MRLTIIGSGNVATHVAAALKNAGHHIIQVYSRDAHNAALLAYHVKAEPVNDLNDINADTGLFIIAVNDDAIESIAQALAVHNVPMVHTSGATPLSVLQKYSQNCGVFYPLQTFSKTREVDFRTVPLCLEASNDAVYPLITSLARDISNNVYDISSEQRKVLHLAAVFANNFPNYLYYAAQQIVEQHQMNFDMLRPLILETAQKVQQIPPQQAQTGPAVRDDQKTMAAHLALLPQNGDMHTLYELLSQLIIKMDIGKRRD